MMNISAELFTRSYQKILSNWMSLNKKLQLPHGTMRLLSNPMNYGLPFIVLMSIAPSICRPSSASYSCGVEKLVKKGPLDFGLVWQKFFRCDIHWVLVESALYPSPKKSF